VTDIRHPSLDADWMPATPVPPQFVRFVCFLDADCKWRVVSAITEWRLEWRGPVGDHWYTRARCRRSADLRTVAGQCCQVITDAAYEILLALPDLH
jgi:hypothetical protein